MIIDGTPIGVEHPTYIIAELSANHNGSLDRAIKLIGAAAEAGANAVKLQCYHPAKLALARGGIDKVLETGPWAGRTLIDIYEEGHTPREWFPTLFEHADRSGITIFSSVFDEDDVDFLERLTVPAYKISSFDFGNLPLIGRAAETRKPLLMSTGMANESDIRATQGAAATLNENIAYLHCVSAYPTPVEEANLGRVAEFHQRFYRHGWAIGFSDHTLGNDCAIGAVALGACIIEKHLTLARAEGGLDAEFSCEPHELKALVTSVTNVWRACQPPSGKAEIYKSLRVEAA